MKTFGSSSNRHFFINIVFQYFVQHKLNFILLICIGVGVEEDLYCRTNKTKTTFLTN